MVKTFVACLAALLVLVGPAAAQGPTGEPDPASGEPPQDPPSDSAGNGTGDPATEPQPAGNGTAGGPSPSVSVTCPLVKSNVGDPRVPMNQWVIVDPHGCFQQVVARIVGAIPPNVVTRRLGM